MKRVVIIGVVAVLIATIASLPIVVAGALPWGQEDTDKEKSHAGGWLGVRIAQINQGLADRYDLTVDAGVVVVQVQDGGPADDAGVEAGDVFKTIGDTTIEEVDEVLDVVSDLEPGTEVTVALLRGSDEIDVQVTLGESKKPIFDLKYARPGSLFGSSKGFPGNLVQTETEMLDRDGNTVTVGMTVGTVQSATDDSLTIVRRDDEEVTFRATDDTKVLVGGQSINISGLKEDTAVRVVTKDGDLSMVVAWPSGTYRGRFYFRSGLYKPGMEKFGFRSYGRFSEGSDPSSKRMGDLLKIDGFKSYGRFPVELAPSFKDRFDDLPVKRFKSKDEWEEWKKRR